ncbi:hypothetical protein DFH11DRAFT_1769003 [Phellopilus nigrolimitatus]|nr:hypothetical protein DFH11DRAFT_1769003 [Phellopilus nigrolimitatus]
MATTQPSGKTSLLTFPDEILLKIFSELSSSNSNGRTRGLWNPFFAKRHCRGNANCDDILTRFSLTLVSKLFHALTKELLYEFVYICNVRGLCALSNALENSSDLAGNLARYTRRMDIILLDEPESPSGWDTWNPDERPKAKLFSRANVTSVYTLAEAILRHCTSLTHLSVCMLFEPTDGEHPFGDVVMALCPSLQVLDWRFASKIRLAPLLRNLATELRVLEVSNVAIFCDATELGVAEMPHLHTIKGAIDILIPALHGVHLPSLTTFIAELHKGKNYVDDALNEMIDEFLEKYGRQISTFVSFSDAILVDLTTMPNLRELGFHMSDVRLLSTRGPAMLDLKRIGIVGVQDFEDLSTRRLLREGNWNERRKCYSDNFLTAVIRNFENILDDHDTAFPALKTAQLLDVGLSQTMGPSRYSPALLEKFEAAGIEVLNDIGDPVRPVIDTKDLDNVRKQTSGPSGFASARLSHRSPGSSSRAFPRKVVGGRTVRTIRNVSEDGGGSVPTAPDVSRFAQTFDFTMKLVE